MEEGGGGGATPEKRGSRGATASELGHTPLERDSQ